MTDIAKRDQNYIPAIQGVSSVDGITPVDIHVNPVSHGIVIDAASTHAALDPRYVNATGDTMTGDLVMDDASITGVEKVVFDTSYTTGGETSGTLYWNNVDGTLDVVLNGVNVHVGQQLYFYGKASGAITKGDLVQFAGVQGSHILIKKCVVAEIQANPTYLIGVASEDVANNDFGYVTYFGFVNDVYTNTPNNGDSANWVAGDVLYFSNTTGELTKTVPTKPNTEIEVAVVVKIQTGNSQTGRILVRPTMYHKLGELSDVDTTSIGNGKTLVWDNTNSKWVMGDHGSLSGLADDDHTQYVVVSPANSTRNVIQPTGNFIPLTLKGNATQTANIFEVQNSSATILASIGSGGRITTTSGLQTTRLTLTEQSTEPSTPASGFTELYVDTTPALKFKNDSGTVVTLSDTTHTHAASAITSGTLDNARIPSLPASQITSGTLDVARIPSLPASQITSGTLANARVNWAAPSAIGGTTPAAGTFTEANITGAAGTDRWLVWRTASSSRWGIRTTNSAESGSNAGSNFAITAFNDTGGLIGSHLAIARATGVLTAVPTYSNTITSGVRDLQIDSSGNLGYVASARKYKHKIRPIKETPRFLAKLRELNPVRYRYKVDGDGDGKTDDVLIHYGFVAEEMEEVFPELCSYDIVPDEGAEIIRDENGKLDPSVPTHKELATLNYSEMHAIAIAGLQHALNKIDELETKIKELEKNKNT